MRTKLERKIQHHFNNIPKAILEIIDWHKYPEIQPQESGYYLAQYEMHEINIAYYNGILFCNLYIPPNILLASNRKENIQPLYWTEMPKGVEQ